MNYLAHIYLSGEDDDLKIGNFIADSIKGKRYLTYPLEIQKGIVLHRAIDSFTDSHPVVKQSVHRLFPEYSHYSAVIIDILYDHYLAANWKDFSDIPLDVYVDNFYQLLTNRKSDLPKKVQNFLPYMIEDNWLLSYASIEGIGKILFQMNRRTENRSRMDLAVKELKLYYELFEIEFRTFFPELEQFAAQKIITL